MKKKHIIPAIFGGIIGGIAGYTGAKFFFADNGNKEMIIPFLFAMVISYILHIIIHEGGHLVFGLLSGYEFVSFRVGSLILYKSNGKYAFGKYKLAGTGGQCLMAPPDLVDGMIPYRLYNMGGAIMNLLFSIPTIVILSTASPAGVVKIICMAWIFVGLFAAATNGIPMSVGQVDNDGKNAISLGKNEKALRAFWLQLKVNQMQVEGKSLMQMPEEWFAYPEKEDMQNPMTAVLGALYCNRLMEERDYESVSSQIEEMIRSAKGMLGVHKILLQIDQVFCEIMSNQNEKVLGYMKDKQIQSFMKAMKNYPAILRTQYAYSLHIEKDSAKAEKLKEQFEKITKTHPIQGELIAEKQYILDCKNK